MKMTTSPRQWYTICAAPGTVVTATANGKTYTLTTVGRRGQASFQAISESIDITDEDAFVLPSDAPAAACGGGFSSDGMGESITRVENNTLTMVHASWFRMAPEATGIMVSPAPDAPNEALSAQLLLTPAADLASGWLVAADGCTLEWVAGEPVILAGYSYVVTLVQVSPTRILANLNMPFAALS